MARTKTHSKHLAVDLKSLSLLVLILCVVLLLLQYMPTSGRTPTSSSETRFVEHSSGGLNIVPASCASSPAYFHAFLTQAADHVGYKSNSGESEYGLTRNFISSNEGWKVTTSAPPGNWNTLAYDDSAWANSYQEGAYGIGPWTGGGPSGPGIQGWPAGTLAYWIWYHDSITTGDSSVVYFRQTFKAPAASITVMFTADDSYVAYLDGAQIASGAAIEGASYGWTTPESATLNLTPDTKHVLAVRVTNTGGAGGLLVDGGTNFFTCVTNTSGKTYFVPAGSAAELQSFKSGAASIPGLSVY